MSFFSIDWGKDEANGDEKLKEYFYPIPGYEGIITGDKRYVIGRKGTGKTAICERLRIESSSNSHWYTTNLSLRGFPLGSFRTLRNRSFKDKSQYVPIWKFLMLTEMARLVLSDPIQNYALENEGLKKFIFSNFPFGTFSETLQTLEDQNGNVIIESSLINPTLQGETTIRFEKVIPWLQDQLKKIHSDSKYFILMDELDEGYSAGDSSLRLILLALLRSTEELSLLLQKGDVSANYRFLVVLRSDIYGNLEDNDLNKLDDALIKLRWNSSPTASYSLRSIVNARIKASLGSKVNDAWKQVVIDSDPELPTSVATVWKYISNRTFERPRDLLKFLKYCSSIQNANPQLLFKVVREAENEYSDWFYNELRDEIQAHLSIWSESLSCLTKVGKGIMSVDDLKKELSRDRDVYEWMKNNNKSEDFILEKLFDFGVIGTLVRNTTWAFKYKDHTLKWNSNGKIIVHFGLHKKLRLRQGRNS
ncbi:P-loop ATPase, Sll1717 family [Paenibacillus terrigena]|uniref:P-loop ATPase, Sll1717 family n=1 Tax=Paenibacillus terrigena TaxID=369333 RepID=UPI00037EB4A7|nr:hypothetical protein [Paenibacillus terrigena]